MPVSAIMAVVAGVVTMMAVGVGTGTQGRGYDGGSEVVAVMVGVWGWQWVRGGLLEVTFTWLQHREALITAEGMSLY